MNKQLRLHQQIITLILDQQTNFDTDFEVPPTVLLLTTIKEVRLWR